MVLKSVFLIFNCLIINIYFILFNLLIIVVERQNNRNSIDRDISLGHIMCTNVVIE